MTEEKDSMMDILLKASEESNGETVDLIVDHGEIRGITLEMLNWWNRNINDTDRYRMWHPKDHVSFEWETPAGPDTEAIKIGRAEERIGEFPASVLRIHGQNPDSVIFPTIYKHFHWANILDSNDKPIAYLCHEYEEIPEGIRMRSTFRFPAKTPQRFLDAMHEHCRGEMGNLPTFLPELYKNG